MKENSQNWFDRTHQENAWDVWTTLLKANTIHSNCTVLVFDSTYTKETLKGTLVHACPKSDKPLCAFSSNPKAFYIKSSVLQYPASRRNYIIIHNNAVHNEIGPVTTICTSPLIITTNLAIPISVTHAVHYCK